MTKEMKKQIEKSSKNEIKDAHILPSELTKQQQNDADKEFSVFRLNRLKRMTEEERIYSRILQIKYMMEDYFKSNTYNSKYSFSHFLREYIHSINRKDNEFSKEISLHVTQLSRILNNKEEPNKKLLVRLEIHSNNWIPALYWYRVLEKQKESEIINDKSIRLSEKKNVRAIV